MLFFSLLNLLNPLIKRALIIKGVKFEERPNESPTQNGHGHEPNPYLFLIMKNVVKKLIPIRKPIKRYIPTYLLVAFLNFLSCSFKNHSTLTP